jgi:hypothetical protein
MKDLSHTTKMDNRRKRRTLKDIHSTTEVLRENSNIGIIKIGDRRGIWYLTSFSCIQEYYYIMFDDKIPTLLSTLTSSNAEYYRMKNIEFELKLRDSFLQSWNSSYSDMLWLLLESSKGIITDTDYMKIITYLSIIGEEDIEESISDISEVSCYSDIPVHQQLQDNMDALALAFSNDNTRVSIINATVQVEDIFLEKTKLK